MQKYSLGEKVVLYYCGVHYVTIAEITQFPISESCDSLGDTFYKVRYKNGYVSSDWFKPGYLAKRED